MIKSLKLTNFLSFGPFSETVQLDNLNVLIGANGSGKSNFIAAFDILKNAPSQIERPIRSSGGVEEWLWKGEGVPRGTHAVATIEAKVEIASGILDPDEIILDYKVSFSEIGKEMKILDEQIQYANSSAVTYSYLEERNVDRKKIDPRMSILAQWKGPNYSEIDSLADVFSDIELYREWASGPYTPYRIYQRADLSIARLEPDASNLAHVLHKLWQEPNVKQRFRDALDGIYQGIEDFGVDLAGGALQIYFREGRSKIPATHLSDGTLHYLALLAILCDPNPPPLVCIEEPELGLHPDVFTVLPDLFREASERCQLIVTTHSVDLVDAMTETPECVLVCEKGEQGTVIARPKNLGTWIEDHRLGDLWRSGQIGGNRW